MRVPNHSGIFPIFFENGFLTTELFVCLLLYIHGKQVRSCQYGKCHTDPGQASLRQFTSIWSPFLPVTDNLLLLNKRNRETYFQERMCRIRGSISGLLVPGGGGVRVLRLTNS